MTRPNVPFAACLLILTAVATTSPAESYGAGALGPFAVVASKDLPVDGLSFAELRRLYMGNSVMVDGKALIPLTFPRQSAERLSFDEAVLDMSAEDTGRFWIDRKIRGQSGPPKSVESAAVILRVVTKVDGAVGFVKAGAVGKSVKILRIDGKLPRDP